MASANSSEEDLYDWYFVLDGFEKGVEAQESGVVNPLGPMGVGSGGTTSRDSKLHIFLSRAEVTDEVAGKVGVTSLKDCFCGYLWLKRETKAGPEEVSSLEASSAIGLEGPGI